MFLEQVYQLNILTKKNIKITGLFKKDISKNIISMKFIIPNKVITFQKSKIIYKKINLINKFTITKTRILY